jgi:hypothetical protein
MTHFQIVGGWRTNTYGRQFVNVLHKYSQTLLALSVGVRTVYYKNCWLYETITKVLELTEYWISSLKEITNSENWNTEALKRWFFKPLSLFFIGTVGFGESVPRVPQNTDKMLGMLSVLGIVWPGRSKIRWTKFIFKDKNRFNILHLQKFRRWKVILPTSFCNNI